MAKYLLLPGTYPAGTPIPLIGTDLTGGSSQYHESGSAVVQLRGSGCTRNPARYNVAVNAAVTGAAAPEQLALVQDGVRVTGGLLAVVSNAIANVLTASNVNEVAAVGSARISVEAVTNITISDGALVIHRTA